MGWGGYPGIPGILVIVKLFSYFLYLFSNFYFDILESFYTIYFLFTGILGFFFYIHNTCLAGKFLSFFKNYLKNCIMCFINIVFSPVPKIISIHPFTEDLRRQTGSSFEVLPQNSESH